MGFFKDLWDGVKSIGSWVGGVFVDFAKGLWAALTGLAGTALGWLIVGAYLTWLWARNLGKERAHLSPCLIRVIEHLFFRDVDLSKVTIIVNASGVANATAVTNGHTIYWTIDDFDEYADMHLLLHELRHTQQYSDWGYFAFASLYAQQAAYYVSHDAMPIEKEAAAFADANYADSRSEYRYECMGVPRPGEVVLEKESRRPGDWTMLLGLV
jgi:hypothetical protein